MKPNREDTLILIPSYEPDQHLIDVVNSLKDEGFSILVVDDGSGENYKEIFRAIKPFVTLVTNENNLGKGNALKVGFSYINDNFANIKFIITVDGDGQHAFNDIINISYTIHLANRPVLGVRDFKGKIPFRSRFGNDLSRFTQTIVNNRYILDNQCGLRAFTFNDLSWLIKVKGSRYEYEMNVISYMELREILFETLPVETIYEANNQTSHFRPVPDTIRIQSVIFSNSWIQILTFAVSLILTFVFYEYVFGPNNLDIPFSYELAAIISYASGTILQSVLALFIRNPIHPMTAFLRNIIISITKLFGLYLGVLLFARFLSLPITLAYFISSVILLIPTYYLLKAFSYMYETRD